jgi:hypothetical protein
MMVLDIEAWAAIALSLSVLTAGAWLVRRRSRDAGWGHTIQVFPAAPVGANFCEWLGRLAYPVIVIPGADPLHRLRTSMFFPLPPQKGVVT